MFPICTRTMRYESTLRSSCATPSGCTTNPCFSHPLMLLAPSFVGPLALHHRHILRHHHHHPDTPPQMLLLSLLVLLAASPALASSSAQSCSSNPFSTPYTSLKSPHSSKDPADPKNLGLLPRGPQVAMPVRVANLESRLNALPTDLDRYTLLASVLETDSNLYVLHPPPLCT